MRQIKQMKNLAILACICLFLFVNCSKLSLQNPDKARIEADVFLKTLYLDNKYEDAYEMTDPSFQQDHNSVDMETAISMWEKKFGKTIGFNATSYLEFDNNIIAIYFQSVQEKGVLFHKVELKLDPKSGYKVIAVYISENKFKEYRDPIRFDQ